jgi:hypothetical protein
MLLLAAWHVFAPSTPASDPAPLPRWEPAQLRPSTSTVGTGRCSAVACHGSPLPVGGTRIFHDEHTIWITRDPHAEAYQVLHSELSQNIVRLLNNGSRPAVPAHKDDRCLVCHATAAPSAAARESTSVVEESVGCESCHGPAQNWLERHTTDAWAVLPAGEKEQRFGMYQTADLARRAAVCAGCHVGGPSEDGRPARDVNHDLIAAGHPRLAFELSGFLANLPAHWNEKGRNAAPDFPARAWAVGQLVSASAALEQLANRARDAKQQSGRWPELSEYDCASCHHELNGSHSVRAAGLGTPRWGKWYYSMAPMLAESLAKPQASSFEPQLADLTRTMSAPSPDPGHVVTKSTELAAELARCVRALDNEAFEPAKLATAIRAIQEEQGASSQDETFQQFLALVPLRQAFKAQHGDDADLLRTIESLRARLRRSNVSPELPTNPGP